MRLFARNPHRELERKLGYRFRSRALLEIALMHRSRRHETVGIQADNQRLEFLGDVALGLVASEYLFKAYPALQEGALTCLRSRLTSGKALARLGRVIELGANLKLGKGELLSGGAARDSNIADALEAVLGAAYLDRGLPAVERIFRTLFLPLIEIEPEDAWSDNPKGRLQVEAQHRWRANPRYRVVRQEGPSHARVFTVHASLSGRQLGVGRGATVRDAEQGAAADALQRLPPK